MVDTPKTEVDFEKLSDEDFLKLDEADFSGNVPEGETNLTGHEPTTEGTANEEDPENPDGTVDPDNTGDGGESGDPESGTDPNADPSKEAEGEEDPDGTSNTGEGTANPHAEDGKQDPTKETAPEGKQPEADASEEGKKTPETGKSGGDVDAKVKDGKAETPAKAGYYKLPEGMDTAKMDVALGFYEKLSVPFKADGKDFSIRSPEDAIRLMQQGVNYSRRMQEIKPMKALNRVLQDNGLADQSKLNFAIDLIKGDKTAITQLLKSHKIDPMDLDTEKDSGYQANNYAGNAQDNDFRDALDETLATPEGQALVTHINADWDKMSKGRLRENPAILGNLQQLKSSGVYDKVVEELNYQKSMGYLTGVPFLQAFDQVGEAMKNAGVFESQQPDSNGNPMAPLNAGQPQGQPVASGARKSTGTKKPETNPHLSSTPPSKQTGKTNPTEPDYEKMSDEEFLKMAPPS